MRRAALAAAIAATAILTTCAPALAQPSAPTANETESTWVAGHVVKLSVQTPDPANLAPDPALSNAEVIVAVHDTVQAGRHGPANCHGVDVLPGPRATPQTVLTRPDPNGGVTLAYAVKFGPVRLDLTSAAIIELAARAELLTLDHSWPGYGGICWTGSGRR